MLPAAGWRCSGSGILGWTEPNCRPRRWTGDATRRRIRVGVRWGWFEVDVEKFGRRVVAIRRRVAILRDQSDDGTVPGAALMPKLFGQIEIALEELTWAGDELQRRPEPPVTSPVAEAGQQRYQALYECAPFAYLATDPDGTVQEINRAARKLLGLREAPGGLALPAGSSIAALVADEERLAFERELTRLRWVDWLEEPRELVVRLQPRGRAPFNAVATVVAVGAACGQPDTLAWLLEGMGEGDRRRAETTPNGAARTTRRERVVLRATDMASRVDGDLMPVGGAVGLSLRHPNLPPDLRIALGQAAVALDGAVQWMAKLRQTVHADGTEWC